MNIRKLPSGSYQVRKQYKGKQYNFTLDHKPTQKEVYALLSDKLEEATGNGSLDYYCKEYIKTKENVLSPSTIRGYTSLHKAMSEDLKKKDFYKITVADVQKEINIYSINHTPKSTSNLFGFISAVFRLFRPSLVLHLTLPQKKPNEGYIPSDEEVKKILERAKGTEYEVALWLACFGLRRGEICALTLEDLSCDNMLTINKSLCYSLNGKVVKSTKTLASIRTIAIPEYVGNLIRKQGYIYRKDMHSILKHLHAYQDELEIPRFTLHKLRHYFASTLSSAGVPENDLLKMGGWATPSIMKSVYRHSMMDKDIQAKKELANTLSKNLL